MKKFNREKSLRKIEFKRKWRSYSRYVYIVVPCVLCCLLCLYFAYSKFFVSEEQAVIRTTVGAYIDGEYSSTIPGRNDRYIVEKVSCDNGSSGKWDYGNWGLLTTNFSKSTKCNVYFKKPVSNIDYIIAQLDTSGKCPTMNADGSVNVTGVEATNSYLCKAKDAYGDSYYYRGNVTNNYVKFGEWKVQKYFGYYNDTSSYYRVYDSLKECQEASTYNVNCRIGIDVGMPMYWRIVRINGDGTVRVIYDGTSAHVNGEASENRQIGTSAFNSSYNDNAYVGYMYGNSDAMVESPEPYSSTSFTNTDTFYISKEYTFDKNTKLFTLKNPIRVLGSNITTDYIGYYYDYPPTSVPSSTDRLYKIRGVTAGSSRATIKYGFVYYGTSSKEVAQTNRNDSAIKTYLDNWYKTNIVGTTNEQYLTDNVFCNDRTISSNKPYGYNNLGYGRNNTAYRWYYEPWSSEGYKSSMKLICSQKNDAFTVSDTTNGNGALTYPVGLLSVDEIVLAGGWNDANSGYYLYSGHDWWASSPDNFRGTAGVQIVYLGGNAGSEDIVDTNNGVRPVFNLKAEVLAQGSGTASDPYRISLTS